MTDRELMQMANRIEVLAFEMKAPNAHTPQFVMLANEIRARARLAQPEPEPVATVYDAYDATGIDWHCKDAPSTGTKLYTAPPQRDETPAKAVEWQGLTLEEREELRDKYEGSGSGFISAIEAKLKEKNA